MMTKEVRLVFQAAGIYVCFLTLGFLTEKLTKNNFHNELFVMSVCSLLNFIVCRLVLALRRRDGGAKFDQRPFKWIALSFMVGTLASHAAMRFVSYPAQVLGKSMKPVAVILSNTLFLGTRYPFSKYLVVVAITVGISLYSWSPDRAAAATAATDDSDAASLLGVGLIFLSLACDGATASMQDRWSRGERERGAQPDSVEAQYYTNLWGFFYVAVAAIFTGEIWRAAQAVTAQPQLIVDLLVFAVCSTVGQFFIYALLTEHGGLVNSVVTTTRKFFSILVSVVLFNPGLLLGHQWLGIVLVFAALLYDGLASRNQKPAHQSQPSKHHQL